MYLPSIVMSAPFGVDLNDTPPRDVDRAAAAGRAVESVVEISRSPSMYAVISVPFEIVMSLPRMIKNSGESKTVPIITVPVLSSPLRAEDAHRRRLPPSGDLT